MRTNETLDFGGRTAIVTGAGRGLGRAHALLLAARGANVVVNDLGGEVAGGGAGSGPAAAVVEEIVAAGGSAVADPSSVAEPRGAAAIVARAREAFGGVDIVVNNAGVITTGEFPADGLAELRLNLEVHVQGSYNVTLAAWEELRESDAPRVLLTTSAAIFGAAELVEYGAAKGGLVGLATGLAAAGAEAGIGVNLLAPFAKTRMVATRVPAAFERLAPESNSPVMAALVHESCRFSGRIYAAGGGRVARILIGETEGIAKSDLTPEDVAGRWAEIDAADALRSPADLGRYTVEFLERLPAVDPTTP